MDAEIDLAKHGLLDHWEKEGRQAEVDEEERRMKEKKEAELKA